MDIRFLFVGAPFIIAFFTHYFGLKNGELLNHLMIISQKK